MTRVYSADWLLPVEGEPIEEGGLAVDAGRIVEVGPADDLEGERLHYEHAVIIPGLVNAHTHLEYAAYAGFGDGLSFAPWISLHIARKRRLDWDGHLAIARLGAAECLASGVTTVADSSFAGAAAAACAELGLRGTVYLEVFGGDPAGSATSSRTCFGPGSRRTRRTRCRTRPTRTPTRRGSRLRRTCTRAQASANG